MVYTAGCQPVAGKPDSGFESRTPHLPSRQGPDAPARRQCIVRDRQTAGKARLLLAGLLAVLAGLVPVRVFALRAHPRFPFGLFAGDPFVPAAFAAVAPKLYLGHTLEYIP